MLNGLKRKIQNAFIGKVIEKTLDGFTGSNILGAVLVAMQAANIDYVLAVQGFKCDDWTTAQESLKLVGAVVTGIFSFYVGRKKKSEAEGGDPVK